MAEVSEATAKIAKILRVDKDEVLLPACKELERITGRTGVLEGIAEENESQILDKIDILGVERAADARDVYDALINKLRRDDQALFDFFRQPDYTKPEAYKTVLGFARELAAIPDGFFLKHKKAEEFLRANPPQKILSALGYQTVSELLAKEDLLEIYAAMRFLESQEWMNEVFFKQYESLQPDDFEKRQIDLRVISSRWVKAAERFMQKKYHNLSHLKELGVIFIIPWSLGYAGETIRMFSLLLHYLHEVNFYARLFEFFSRVPEMFATNLISALRGDVPQERPPETKTWLIIQRYLAKDDENDWRLVWPHVNPEAMHWQKAEDDLVKMGSKFQIHGLRFWRDTDWIGNFFPTPAGIDVLVSFDLVDTAMSLVQQKELVKYFYHQQEALWNKIFSSYVGEKELHDLMVEHFMEHEIRLSKLALVWEKLRQ